MVNLFRIKPMVAAAIALAGFLGTATHVQASLATESAQQPLALVEFASFDCPYCQAMSAHHADIERVAARAGIEYRYAPLPSHGRYEAAWRERAYYASRELPDIATTVKDAFLAAGEAGVPLDDLDAVVAHLEIHAPRVHWDAFTRDYIQSNESLAALERAVRLAGRAGLRSYPAFAVIGAGGVELLNLPSDVADKARAVIDYLESL